LLWQSQPKKSELLGGAATSRIEHKKVITREELQAMFDAYLGPKPKSSNSLTPLRTSLIDC